MEATTRPAAEDDLERINEIYNYYIVDRHTSFDAEPWTLEERRQWFAKYQEPGRYHALVMEVDGRVVGFASTSPFRPKSAYDTSVETTIVLEERATGRALGRPLLEDLLRRAAAAGAHRAYALIALPNDPAVAFHAGMGFVQVGVLDEVGHKLGRFNSVQIMESRLG